MLCCAQPIFVLMAGFSLPGFMRRFGFAQIGRRCGQVGGEGERGNSGDGQRGLHKASCQGMPYVNRLWLNGRQTDR
jgi:hypothetical protein